MGYMATINDLVLIYFEDKPLTYARIEAIDPDIKRGWYHVKLMLLQIPLQVVSWILRDAYIDGEEFTMNGKRMRLEEVICPDYESDYESDYEDEDEGDHMIKPQPVAKKKPATAGKVISLSDLKKK
jgi:hypothetical protein